MIPIATTAVRHFCVIGFIVVISCIFVRTTDSDSIDVVQAQTDPAPYVIWWPNPNVERAKTPVGLLYTPEMLAKLVARLPPETVSPRMADVVRQQVAIVVM